MHLQLMNTDKKVEREEEETMIGTVSSQYFNSNPTISVKASVTQKKVSGTKILPPDFQPGKWTVVCGRGRDNYSAVGNLRLKVLVDTRLQQYQEATTKIQKSLIVSSLVEAVHEAAGEEAFVKRDTANNRWIVVSEETAREKVRRLEHFQFPSVPIDQ